METLLLYISGGVISGLMAVLFWIVRMFIQHINKTTTHQDVINNDLYNKYNAVNVDVARIKERLNINN